MLYDFVSSETIKNLKSDDFDWDEIPKVSGIYIVMYQSSDSPKFLTKGSGGWFKGNDPNVPKEELHSKWIDFKTKENKIIYIGKAGGENTKNTLRNRIKVYIKFGKGKPVSHRGGRYIWQLANSDDLEIFWKEAQSPGEEEKLLLEAFKNIHTQLPFANLRM